MADGRVLLTGFPGFIGWRLAARLVEDGRSASALVERRMAETAREWGSEPPTPCQWTS